MLHGFSFCFASSRLMTGWLRRAHRGSKDHLEAGRGPGNVVAMPPKDVSDDGPEWLRSSGVRVDEHRRRTFARRLQLECCTQPPPTPAELETRAKNLKRAGPGVLYQPASEPTAASSSSAAPPRFGPEPLENRNFRMLEAAPASFSPSRYVFYVHGRPCVVLAGKIHVCAAIPGSRAHRRCESRIFPVRAMYDKSTSLPRDPWPTVFKNHRPPPGSCGIVCCGFLPMCSESMAAYDKNPSPPPGLCCIVVVGFRPGHCHFARAERPERLRRPSCYGAGACCAAAAAGPQPRCRAYLQSAKCRLARLEGPLWK